VAGKHFAHFSLDDAVAAARTIAPRRTLLVGMTCSIGFAPFCTLLSCCLPVALPLYFCVTAALLFCFTLPLYFCCRRARARVYVCCACVCV
jgi:hypothetical protein